MDELEVMKLKCQCHFIVDDEHYATRFLYQIPRVGDEVRFKGDEFYTVERIVWPMDEENHHRGRCNIAVTRV